MNQTSKQNTMRKLAPLMVILAGSFWGCLGIFVRQLNAYGFDALDIVALRMVGACIILFAFLLIYNRRLLIIKWKDLWCFLGTGVLSIVFFNYCYFNTIRIASLSLAAIMLYTAPAIVTVLGMVLFGESFQWIKMLSLFLAFGGCVLVTGVLTDTMTLTLEGILLGLGSGIGYALYSIFGRYAIMRGYGSLTISVYTFFFGAAGSLLLIDKKAWVAKAMQPECMPASLGMVLLGTIAAYVLYTLGLSYMEAGRASILACVEPMVATLMGFLLYKEELDGITLLGVILVLLSAVLLNLTGKDKEKPSGEEK